MPDFAESVLPLDGSPLAELRSRGWELTFNWGGPSGLGDGSVSSNVRAVPELTQASLSSLDTSFLRRLARCADPGHKTISFVELIFVLHCEEGIDPAWVQELLAFAPDVTVGGIGTSPVERAQHFVERGLAAPLAAILLLTMRSNYWTKQLRKYGLNSGVIEFYGQMLEDLEFFVPDLLAHGNWNAGHFEAFRDLTEIYLSCWRGTPEYADCKRVTDHFEIMARAAGAAVPSIGKFFVAYDEWGAKRDSDEDLNGHQD